MRLILLGGMLCFGSMASAQYTRTDHFDAAVLTLQRCTASSNTGEQHALIVSLRALNDQTLRPFFQSLTKSASWSSRVDGILGLAELSARRDIEISLLNQLSAEDRSTVLRNAVGFRLIQPETIREILKIKDLPLLDVVVLNAELHRVGEKFSGSGLETAVTDPSDEISGLAAALLLETGNESPWKIFTAQLATRSPEIRNVAIQELARAVQLYCIRASIAPIVQIVQDPSYTVPTRMIVTGAALALDPAIGRTEWRKFTAQERGQSAVVRAGLQLMSQEKIGEAGLGSSLRNGEPLVEAIADAIEANASGDPNALASALEVVIDRANRPSAEWVVKRAASLPPPLAAQVWKHLLVWFLTAPANTTALSTVILDCASRLALVDAGTIENLIRLSETERQFQEILILALCNAATPEAATVAERVRGSLSRRGDALAILAVARGKPTLAPDLLRELGIVAAGGGDLDPTLLVQSAWLFARHSGKADQALLQIQNK
jgi:hypothetical protein